MIRYLMRVALPPRLLTALSSAVLLLAAPQLCHARTALNVPFVGQWDYDITALRVTPDKAFPGDAITVSVDIACRTCSGNAGDVAVIVQLHDSRQHVDEFTQYHRLGPAGSRDTVTFTHQLTRPGPTLVRAYVKGGAGYVWAFDETLNHPRVTEPHVYLSPLVLSCYCYSKLLSTDFWQSVGEDQVHAGVKQYLDPIDQSLNLMIAMLSAHIPAFGTFGAAKSALVAVPGIRAMYCFQVVGFLEQADARFRGTRPSQLFMDLAKEIHQTRTLSTARRVQDLRAQLQRYQQLAEASGFRPSEIGGGGTTDRVFDLASMGPQARDTVTHICESALAFTQGLTSASVRQAEARLQPRAADIFLDKGDVWVRYPSGALKRLTHSGRCAELRIAPGGAFAGWVEGGLAFEDPPGVMLSTQEKVRIYDLHGQGQVRELVPLGTVVPGFRFAGDPEHPTVIVECSGLRGPSSYFEYDVETLAPTGREWIDLIHPRRPPGWE